MRGSGCSGPELHTVWDVSPGRIRILPGVDQDEAWTLGWDGSCS